MGLEGQAGANLLGSKGRCVGTRLVNRLGNGIPWGLWQHLSSPVWELFITVLCS